MAPQPYRYPYPPYPYPYSYPYPYPYGYPPTPYGPYAQPYPPAYPPRGPGVPAVSTEPTTRTRTRIDPALPTGIVFASTGALAIAIGAVVLATAKGKDVCSVQQGLGGCVTRPDAAGEIAAGAVLGAGLGMVTFGVPAAVLGRERIPRDGGRKSQAMATGGVVLTAFGSTLLGAGIGALAADGARGDLDATAVSIPLLAIGGALLVTGAPLWGVGAQPIEQAPRDKAEVAR